MKISLNHFILLALYLMLSACTPKISTVVQAPSEPEVSSNTTAEITDKSNWQSHKTDEVYIRYPDDWYLTEGGPFGIVFCIFKEEFGAEGVFRSNINMSIDPTFSNYENLDRYVDFNVNQIMTMIGDFEIIQQTNFTTRGMQSGIFEYRGRMSQLTALPLRWYQQYFIEDGNRVFLLTYTSIDNDDFEADLLKVKAVFEEFKIFKDKTK